jgi:hypothetical protein
MSRDDSLICISALVEAGAGQDQDERCDKALSIRTTEFGGKFGINLFFSHFS